MDGFFYFSIFIMCFAGIMLLLAGLAVLCPDVAKIMTARAVGFFDESRPKESARLIAKMTAFVAVGLAVGGLVGLVFGEKAFFVLPVSIILSCLTGWKFTKKDYYDLKPQDGEESHRSSEYPSRVGEDCDGKARRFDGK